MIVQNAPITTHSLTIILAYLHKNSPRHLPARLLAATHLRSLAAILGNPQPAKPYAGGIRSVRKYPYLAIHFAALHAAGLIIAEKKIVLTYISSDWLRLNETEQLNAIETALNNREQWQHTVRALQLEEVLPIDYTAHHIQQLQHQQEQNQQPLPAKWLPTKEWRGEKKWQLQIPSALPAGQLFDLLQIGTWIPPEQITITSYTIAEAALNGYTSQRISHLLAAACDKKLKKQASQQIVEWIEGVGDYDLTPTVLLTTRTPEHLQQLRQKSNLRAFIHRHITPRHAIVSPQIEQPLRRWLKQRQTQLRKYPRSVQTVEQEHWATQWIGVRVLQGLSAFVDLPVPNPRHVLPELASHLDDQTVADLELRAQKIFAQLEQAIRGTDSFLPTETDPQTEWLDQINDAVSLARPLRIAYQSLADTTPSWREIEPHYLRQQGALYYLHGYCTRVGADRVFRLDRISEITDVSQEE